MKEEIGVGATVIRTGLKWAICLVLGVATVTLVGCSRKPSERDARTVVENMKNQSGQTRITAFKKVNASAGVEHGQETYTIECTYDIELLNPEVAKALGAQGHLLHFGSDAIHFEKTEKGWKGPDGKLY
jgi:hypothetical protein